MKAVCACTSLVLLTLCCTACGRHKTVVQAPAQAPPLQTGKGTLSPPQPLQPEKTDHPLASPLPPPSTVSVALPPPPPPRKARKKVKPTTKPAADTQTAAAPPAAAAPAQTQAPASTQPAPTAVSQTQAANDHLGAASPIGELTTGDVALGEKTKHETADLINDTQKGLGGIRRNLSPDEKTTTVQIHTFLRQAQQALDNGDTDGALNLATKAKLLLDELTKP